MLNPKALIEAGRDEPTEFLTLGEFIGFQNKATDPTFDQG